jgi:hypothetical protein
MSSAAATKKVSVRRYFLDFKKPEYGMFTTIPARIIIPGPALG